MTRDIEGIEKAVSAMGRWAPSDLACIERLDFRANGENGSTLSIVGLFQRRSTDAWPSFDRAMYRVHLLFEGVNGLRLKDFGSGYVQIMGFDIHSIADRGWENVFFEVEDYEDGRIGFTCAQIHVVEVEEKCVNP